MDPLLIVIVLSALVTVFPLLKGLWQKVDQTAVVQSAAVPPSAFEYQATSPRVQVLDPVQSGCMQKLLELAKCLPEEEAQKLVQKYAAVMVMKELGK